MLKHPVDSAGRPLFNTKITKDTKITKGAFSEIGIGIGIGIGIDYDYEHEHEQE